MFYLFILHIVVITRTCDADLCTAIVNIILFIIPEKRLHGNKIKLEDSEIQTNVVQHNILNISKCQLERANIVNYLLHRIVCNTIKHINRIEVEHQKINAALNHCPDIKKTKM
jgi:hypothetical protein